MYESGSDLGAGAEVPSEVFASASIACQNFEEASRRLAERLPGVGRLTCALVTFPTAKARSEDI